MSIRKGILNLKNNCFMNSIFQVLFTIPEFCRILSKFSDNLDQSSYTSHLSSLIQSKSQNKESLKPFIKKCFELFKYSKPFTQQDAGEFFLLLIEKICSEVRDFGEDEKKIEDLFRVEIVTEIFCTEKNMKLNEQFLQLNLEIFDIEEVYTKSRSDLEKSLIENIRKSWICFKQQAPVTILDCIRKAFRNFEREKVDECLICKGSCGGSAEIRPDRLPQYLFLLIKRYKFVGRLKKINRKLQLLNEITIFDQEYELISIVRHSEFLGRKHYKAYCKDGSNWIQCDDEKIKRVTQDTVLDVQPYLILYKMKKNLSDIENLSSSLKDNVFISHDSERFQVDESNEFNYKIRSQRIITEEDDLVKEKDSLELTERADTLKLINNQIDELHQNTSYNMIPIEEMSDRSILYKSCS